MNGINYEIVESEFISMKELNKFVEIYEVEVFDIKNKMLQLELENIIIINGYNIISDSCSFYKLKDNKKHINNINKAKIVLHLMERYQDILNNHYNINYMIKRLKDFILE